MENVPIKSKLEDYTEKEFLRFLQEFFEDTDTNRLTGSDLDRYMDKLVSHFESVTEHPRGSGVLFYPLPGQDDSPEGVLKEVKRWRTEQGLPGFRQ